jgi:hypothetical protein
LPEKTLPRLAHRVISPRRSSQDEQDQHGADGGVDDGTDQSGPEMDAELGQQPASDKGTQDSDDNALGRFRSKADINLGRHASR